ncbi:MAG: hypothetical protein K8S87_09820 [Planctomycetes bacterium]|nr:hypothetical protein [Planctomycetota bacterium]
MKIKKVIVQIQTIIIILFVSVGIWYLVDMQLSDDVTFDIPVVIKLPKTLQAEWIITDQSNEVVKATFVGPKEAISSVDQKQKEIAAFIHVDAGQLTSVDKSEINFSRTIKDISFETDEGKISEALKVSLKKITEIKFQVSRTRVNAVQVFNEDVLDAFDDIPDSKDYQLFIENIEPNNVFIKAPSIYNIPENLKFEKISLANIKGRGIETRKYTRKLYFKYRMDDPSIQFFANTELTKRIAFCEITFGFQYTNIKTKTLSNIPVNIVLPSWCIENYVAVVDPLKYEIQELTVRGRSDILQQLNNTNLILLFFVSEGGIDKKQLKSLGDSVVNASTKYKLYIEPSVIPLTSAANIEIVKGDFTQGLSIELQKFK